MYDSGIYITEPIGNNEFSYQERIALGSEGKIFVPSLIKGSISDLEIGSEIVFEEVEKNKVQSFQGLKHFIATTYKDVPVYIVDNHNHALSFRTKYRMDTGKINTLTVIHIDQHADTKPNNTECKIQNSEGMENFVNTKTNVGNFISAAINNNIIDEVIQIRTEYALQQPGTLNFKRGTHHILDIDMDFREGKNEYEQDFEIIRKMIPHVKMVTIATSPHFFDQKKAIALIKKLF